MMRHAFFATAPKGVESLLADELRALGAEEVAETRAGVAFAGTLETGYRACLWTRLASRILLPLATFPAASPEELYAGIAALDWREHLAPEGTLAVDCNVSNSRITHSHFAALKVKDAIVDRFREECGVRPSVELIRPDIRVNLHLNRDLATVSLDLSGESLHRRGYREEQVLAPLKENLAAAILLRAGWPETAAAGGALLDPMCGSGTLVIEAALMAADCAPGLLRSYYGFFRWRGHDPALWQRLLDEAQARREAGLALLPVLWGFDADRKAIEAARGNARRAGLEGRLHIERREVAALTAPPAAETGLVLVNPPYGERLGEVEELKPLYALLGRRLKEQFAGWRAAVFTGNPELGMHLGIRARRINTLFNGALECKLLRCDLEPRWFVDDRQDRAPVPAVLSDGATMFANRLRKNLKSLGRWAQKNGISCYRLYDADMPEYAVAVDLYEEWVHVQEYQAPATVDPRKARERLREVMAVLPEVLAVPPERIFLKVRQRQKGRAQYDKLGEQGAFHQVREGNCSFWVNFTDYLDTGLFLDHRPTRQLLGDLAAGKRFLNLFAYTGAATVHAALGGAVATTSVDMSRTYLDWARRNLELNGIFGPDHRLVQGDCLRWLEEEQGRYDLIFLDPPTFSTSKSMATTFDVQRDHVPLLQTAAALLAPGGVLIFSNNNRRFKIDAEALAGLQVEDLTRRTIDRDFERNPRIHNCWKITR